MVTKCGTMYKCKWSYSIWLLVLLARSGGSGNFSAGISRISDKGCGLNASESSLAIMNMHGLVNQ